LTNCALKIGELETIHPFGYRENAEDYNNVPLDE
jgi:hypothetical protein